MDAKSTQDTRVPRAKGVLQVAPLHLVGTYWGSKYQPGCWIAGKESPFFYMLDHSSTGSNTYNTLFLLVVI